MDRAAASRPHAAKSGVSSSCGGGSCYKLVTAPPVYDTVAEKVMVSPGGRVWTREQLLDRVWGADFLGGERTVDQHVTQLRAHLGDDPGKPGFLETVRGKGYRMRAWAEGA